MLACLSGDNNLSLEQSISPRRKAGSESEYTDMPYLLIDLEMVFLVISE